jgi:hypothetical protein
MPDTVKDWAKALNKRMRLMKEKEQKAAGEDLEDSELSPELQHQITQLWDRSNEIYESCLRIGASNFDTSELTLPHLRVRCMRACVHGGQFSTTPSLLISKARRALLGVRPLALGASTALRVGQASGHPRPVEGAR